MVVPSYVLKKNGVVVNFGEHLIYDDIINNFSEYKAFITKLKNELKYYKDDIDISSELFFESRIDLGANRINILTPDLNVYGVYVSGDSYFNCYKLQSLMYEGSEYGKMSVVEKSFNLKLFGVDVVEGQEWQYIDFLARYIFLNAQYLFDKYSLTSQVISSEGFKYFKFFYETSKPDYLQVVFISDVNFILYVDITSIKSSLLDIFSYMNDIYPGSAVGYEIGGHIINTITQRNLTPVISGDNNSYYTKSEVDLMLLERDNQINILKSLILNISDTDSGSGSNTITFDSTQFAELKGLLKALSLSMLGGK